MQRFYRLFLLAMIALLAVNVGLAQKPIVYVSGKLAPTDVRTFQKDSLYIFNNEYVVGGTLLIEPGTEIQFYPNGRLIDSTGGRIIADGDASAVYTAKPNNGTIDMDPIAGSSPLNPLGWTGYADLNYFTYSTPSATETNRHTIKVNTVRDLTVHSTKENLIFNLVINKTSRKLKNLTPGYALLANEEIIPFEKAMMLQISRMVNDPNSDALLNNRPWKRIKTTTQSTDVVDITAGTINFKGQNTNNISREWGHIVILPGARAAFFRNCKFEGFKKDTTVDRLPYYNINQGGAGEVAAWRSVNEKLKQLSNGSGGAITSFSERTWLINVEFNNNRAFRRGGALQLLQAPSGFPGGFADLGTLVLNVGEYDLNKNPNITNKDGLASQILSKLEVMMPRISALDEPLGNFPNTDLLEQNDRDRQNWDDARLALYLGRIRNVKFTNNKAQLNNVGSVSVGIPPVTQVTDILTTPATYPTNYGSTVAGGALYISGNGEIPGTFDESNLNETANRMIEVGLGVNNSINTSAGLITFPNADSFIATNNEAKNYQDNPSSPGANGGAIYAGAYTSLIVAGNFTANKAQAPFMQSVALSVGADRYARGGAIFAANTLARLQVVGGKDRDLINNNTIFTRNEAATGGAIYVSGNSSTYSSPIIGGADNTLLRRDAGYNIQFDNNKALVYGGAIYTLRNMYVNGGGGATSSALIGYDDFHRTRFVNNTAGYSGGAISINIPNNSILRSFNRNIEFVRSYFGNNTVGNAVNNSNVSEIRGGGAVYNLNGNIGLIKGVEFNGNVVYNSNGGALTTVHPEKSQRRFLVSDLDVVTYEAAADENNPLATDKIPASYESSNGVFTNAPGSPYPADVRMMTRFIGNKALTPDAAILAAQSGSGVTQVGAGTLKTSEPLKAMFWQDETTGYAVGSNGTVVKFTNGGNDWNYIATGSAANLNDVFFTSTNVGYIVGNQGTLLKTTNGGTTWNAINIDALTAYVDPNLKVVNVNLTSIAFVGSNSGYITTANGYVIRTTDAFTSVGNTKFDNLGNQASPLNNVYASGIDVYTAVGEVKTILKRDLGVPTFTFQASPVNAVYNTAWYTTSTRGYVGGTNGTILKTTNGGIDWSVTNNPATGTIGGLTFITPSKGFAVNGSGKVLTTTDAGDNWTEVAGNTNFNALYDVAFPNTNVGYAVGNAGTLLKTTDGGATWKSVGPADQSVVDVVRKHKGTELPENGIGLGGAIYLLDKANVTKIGRADSIQFNRVRIQNNEAYTGSAIYSDNYDLKLIVNRTLVNGNKANSKVGATQNVITGPIERDNTGKVIANKASSDLVPATIYGEIQGPLPSASFSVAANSIYNNDAKFLIRLPDAPNTKGVLAGTLGLGLGGTDTLRGNYWGQTEANVILEIQNIVAGQAKTTQETFFVEGNGTTVMKFVPTATTNLTEQGPFESISRYAYTPIPSMNDANNEDVPAVNTLPENLLLSGKVYDIYDKGTDIKTADYSKRRMSPIEDFAVGIAPSARTFSTPNTPSNGKHVKRYIRDPFATEALSSGTLTNPWLASMQDEFRPDANGNSYQPLGMPLFLESRVNYDGLIENNNHDPLMLNEAVYFVINQTSGDLIRVNMRQVSEDAPGREVFRARVDLVPDSTYSPATPLERYNRASMRRSGEGIANFGIGSDILNALYRDADKEDRAVLVGRKYDANINEFANDPAIFSNRPSLTGRATYFAGERYRALPVSVGDKIQIISRTALWNQGVAAADAGSVTFTVTNSTMPPRFTGNIISLQRDTIVKIVPSEYASKRALGIPDTIRMVELLNKKFITEDRSYPKTRGTYSATTTTPENGRGTDSILTITATDTNKFYDPRSFFAPDKFPRLTYTWNVDPASGLARWMQADTIKAGTPNNAQNQNPRDLALGYVKFRGQAINPYVVPGGEDVTVTAANYPPSYRLLDSLKAYGITDQNILDYSVNIYGKYFHAPVYDNINARYLQQDTINSGKNYTVSHTYKMFVVDSLPKIFENDEPESAVTRTKSDGTLLDTLVHYVPSVYTCDLTQDGRLKANLTDKLRFQIDINSDDELEDNAAIKTGWDFKYGQSAYAFLNKVRNGGDINNPVDVVLDTTYIWDNDAQKYTAVLNQSKPAWLDDKYMFRYNDETTKDQFVQDFTAKGQINIRIPRNEALSLLTPVNVQNNALNTDTSMTIILNDGHGGKTQKKYNVFVNVAPQILTNSLANAKEDFDYNPQLLDSNINGSHMIKVFDANFGQARTFELIYSSYGSNTISKDPCFPEAGVWDVTNLKTTPNWLKINPITGLLYGKPGIKDAPKTETVTVLVTDAEGLTDLRSYQLVVEKTDHIPNLSAAPNVNCIDGTQSYLETLYVSDRDLIRDPAANPNEENLTLTVVSPSGLTLEPSTIKGPLADSTVKVVIKSTGTGFNPARDNDGKVTVRVEVTDGAGNKHTLVYRLKVSEATRFVSKVKVTNSIGGTQILEWGTADRNVTTGDNTDGAPLGKLDSNYCEYELAPYPPTDVFDARWTIPTINGVIRSIYPASVNKNQIYIAQLQPGDVTGNGSGNYPLTISWDMTSVPDKSDATKNPTGSSWAIRDALSNGNLFSINMNTGDGRFVNGFEGKKNGNQYELTVNNTSTKAFVIFQDWNSDVATDYNPAFTNKISAVSPNPVVNQANIEFELANSNNVSIEIVDMLGNVVATVANGFYTPGQYKIVWTGAENMASGAYVVRMNAGTVTDTYSVTIVK